MSDPNSAETTPIESVAPAGQEPASAVQEPAAPAASAPTAKAGHHGRWIALGGVAAAGLVLLSAVTGFAIGRSSIEHTAFTAAAMHERFGGQQRTDRGQQPDFGQPGQGVDPDGDNWGGRGQRPGMMDGRQGGPGLDRGPGTQQGQGFGQDGGAWGGRGHGMMGGQPSAAPQPQS